AQAFDQTAAVAQQTACIHVTVKAQYKNLILGYRRTIGTCAADHRPTRLETEAGLARYGFIVEPHERRSKLDAAGYARPQFIGENIRPAPVIQPAAIALQFGIITLDLHRRRRLPFAKRNHRSVKRQFDALYLSNLALGAEL